MVKHLDESEMPSALLSPAWFLHRRDAERSVGVWSREARSKLNLKESVDECFRQSSPVFRPPFWDFKVQEGLPVRTVLGLV